MVTIKSYTDIEQSKKLAEILPFESADMNYSKRDTIYADTLFDSCDNQFFYIRGYTPCWSLAALLNALPEIQGSKPMIALDDNYITYPHMSDLHTKADNPVDACYNMIIKLNELKML